MTYQQVWDTMSKRERRANNIMCMFKLNDDGVIDANSIRNKILYRVAKVVLGGVDPLDRIGYYGSLLDEERCNLPELMADLYRLKVAWNKV